LSISDTAKHDFYYWKIDGQDISQNTPTLKIDKSGFYQVKVKDSNGPNAQCESDISNGFNAELINSAVTIAYPNPAKDAIYIESPFLQKNVKVSLIDGSGRLVKEIPNIANWINKLTIPVNDVPPGVYNVILESAETILRKKISIL
jgi:hypothetical protein